MIKLKGKQLDGFNAALREGDLKKAISELHKSAASADCQSGNEAIKSCDHRWNWTLRSGEPWGKPGNIESYNCGLIIGKCHKCGQIHKPKN